MSRTLRAIVYGDVNLNILDGSAIWVQSMSEALSRAGVEVRVLLKAPVETGRLVDPLRTLPGVSVVDPFVSGMASGRAPLSADAAVSLIEGLDAQEAADLVVVRGLRLVTAAAASRRGRRAAARPCRPTAAPPSSILRAGARAPARCDG